jgi:hypothetical protein
MCAETDQEPMESFEDGLAMNMIVISINRRSGSGMR